MVPLPSPNIASCPTQNPKPSPSGINTIALLRIIVNFIDSSKSPHFTVRHNWWKSANNYHLRLTRGFDTPTLVANDSQLQPSNGRCHLELREWMDMDRQAMEYRDVAEASLGGATEDSRRQPARNDYRDRPVLQHRRPEAPAAGRNVQTVNLQSILQGAREAIIDFDGAAYRLRITRNHRLILTK
jgi:hemin uptake protein HemP